ncbi:integrase core domain-containing protein [Streptomyces sp. NPDC001984]
MNARCERVTGTIRREALDHVLIMNEAHARQALAEYQHHYNRQRPHRARDQRPPRLRTSPLSATPPTPKGSYAPASSAESSTSTDTPLELQR